MKRRHTLLVVYAGAWLASIELAFELLFTDTLGTPFKLAARATQIIGLIVAAWGVFQLRRPLPLAVTSPETEVGAFVRSERIMTAYTHEILTHLLMAGMILTVALSYAMVLYTRLLAHTDSRWYYLGIIIATFTALTLAWLLPVRDMLREEKRLRLAAETPYAG